MQDWGKKIFRFWFFEWLWRIETMFFSGGVSNDQRNDSILSWDCYSFVACCKVAFALVPFAKNILSSNMMAAVFAQLFKGILCKGNSTPMFSCVWRGRGLWAHFCAPSSQITSHNSSGRSSAKITFGKCENLDPRSKIDTCFQGGGEISH